MNYRHAFHAGNFADVMKHALLALMVQHLLKKETPFRYLDTHAGVGFYDLTSSEAQRGGEWQDGIGRVLEAGFSPAAQALLAPYLQVVAAMQGEDQAGPPRRYPGSPEVVRRLTREQDRLLLCELHPQDRAQLAYHYGRDERVKVVEIDAYAALNAFLPPKERRGLVLIDPPFEKPGEFSRMVAGLVKAHAKWATGIYALWYPIKDPLESENFGRTLSKSGIGRILRTELLIRRPSDSGRLNGCGLVVVNPPFTLASDAEILLGELSTVLAQAPGARHRVDWLSPPE